MSLHLWSHVGVGRQRRNRSSCCGLIGLVLLLASCSGQLAPQKPLSDLHLPGVAQIPGIAALHAPPQPGFIGDLTAYLPAGITTGRVLFTLDGELYDVGLDGSGLRSLHTPCTDQPAVTSDGRWVVCRDDAYHLLLTSLATGSLIDGQLIVLNDPTHIGSPAWLPDNHHLALETEMGGGCSVAIYAASPGYDHFSLVGLLRFPDFANESGCALFGLTWSPDGAWLAFVVDQTPFSVYIVPTASFLPQVLHAESALDFTIRAASLVQLGTPPSLATPAWSTHDGRLAVTFVGADWQSVVQVDIVARQQKAVLAIPDGYIGSLSWTPDGKHLVFAQERHDCLECAHSFTPAHLYVYTPSS